MSTITKLSILRARVTRAETDLDKAMEQLRDARGMVQNKQLALDEARKNLNAALEAAVA
jgi:flagellin-like hook-associated protein FlgL